MRTGRKNGVGGNIGRSKRLLRGARYVDLTSDGVYTLTGCCPRGPRHRAARRITRSNIAERRIPTYSRPTHIETERAEIARRRCSGNAECRCTVRRNVRGRHGQTPRHRGFDRNRR